MFKFITNRFKKKPIPNIVTVTKFEGRNSVLKIVVHEASYGEPGWSLGFEINGIETNSRTERISSFFGENYFDTYIDAIEYGIGVSNNLGFDLSDSVLIFWWDNNSDRWNGESSLITKFVPNYKPAIDRICSANLTR